MPFSDITPRSGSTGRRTRYCRSSIFFPVRLRGLSSFAGNATALMARARSLNDECRDVPSVVLPLAEAESEFLDSAMARSYRLFSERPGTPRAHRRPADACLEVAECPPAQGQPRERSGRSPAAEEQIHKSREFAAEQVGQAALFIRFVQRHASRRPRGRDKPSYRQPVTRT